jgi:protein O-mannosyl-transferase
VTQPDHAPANPSPAAETPMLSADTPLRVWLGVAIIVFAGAATFSASLGVPFHFEDRLYISENPSVHRVVTVQESFNAGGAGPIAWLSYAINWMVTPGNAAAFHAVNLALHLTNAVLIYFICRLFAAPRKNDVLRWVPLAGGLLFALHPLTTESVNYVVGRTGILATTFVLTTLYAFLTMDDSTPNRKLYYGAIALIGFACAVGTHRVAWLLPVLLLAADWAVNRRNALSRLSTHALAFAATLAVIIATLAAPEPQMQSVDESAIGLDPALPPYVAIARAADLTINRRSISAIQSAELDSVVLEFGASSVENFQETNVIPGLALTALALIGSVVALVLRKPIALGLIWYVAAIIYGAAWARNGMPFSERSVYFAVAGLAFAAAGALTFVGGRQRVRVSAALCVLVLLFICAAASFDRTRTWLREQDIWDLARENAAQSPVPYHRLAVMYGERAAEAMNEARSFHAMGESMGAAAAEDRAREAFLRAAENAAAAIEFGANDTPTRILLGRALAMTGSTDEAEKVLLGVLADDPANRSAAVELASLYETQGSVTRNRQILARSADLYERALLSQPPTETELARYGRVLAQLGDFSGAAAAYGRAAQMNPNSPVIAALEDLQANVQRVQQMEAQARQLAADNPNDPTAALVFSIAMLERNDVLKVLYTLSDVIERHPEFVPGWVTLGFVHARMGETDSFVKHHGAAPPPGENNASPWMDLAAMCAQSNYWDEAAAYLEHAGPATGDDRKPLLIVADLARQLGRSDVYADFLRRATEAYPNDPTPWLVIVDQNIEANNAQVATGALQEAEKRGAPAAEIEKRKPLIEAIRGSTEEMVDTVQ